MRRAVEIDDRLAALKLGRASRILGKGVGELVRFYAAPAVLDLMRSFPPMGSVSGREAFGRQRRLGQAAVSGDLAKVYVSLGTVVEAVRQRANDPDDGAARGFAKLARRGRTAEAQALLTRVGLSNYARMEIGRFDGGAAHRGSRFRGRVRRRREALIVTNKGELRRYERELRNKVGILKAGFLPGYRAAGGRRSVPRWITQQRKFGFVRDDSRREVDPSFTVVNGVTYARQQARGLVGLVLRRNRARMVRGLDGAVRRKLRELG